MVRSKWGKAISNSHKCPNRLAACGLPLTAHLSLLTRHRLPLTAHPPVQGFTLIEVMVVLVIMGMLAGLVSVVVRPGERDTLRTEAERLAQLLDLASAESRFTAKVIAWTADAAGYQFWRFRDDAGWTEIRDHDQLRKRALPPGVTIADLRVENGRPRDKMRIEVTPTGPTYTFSLRMALGAEQYRVAATPAGLIRAAAGVGVGDGSVAQH